MQSKLPDAAIHPATIDAPLETDITPNPPRQAVEEPATIATAEEPEADPGERFMRGVLIAMAITFVLGLIGMYITIRLG